jgi:hypothetical protein
VDFTRQNRVTEIASNLFIDFRNTFSILQLTEQYTRVMKYNINVIKSVWRQWRKPSGATLAAIGSQNLRNTPATQALDSAVWEQVARLEAGGRDLLTRQLRLPSMATNTEKLNNGDGDFIIFWNLMIRNAYITCNVTT